MSEDTNEQTNTKGQTQSPTSPARPETGGVVILGAPTPQAVGFAGALASLGERTQHFQQGFRYFNAQRFEEAIGEFKKSGDRIYLAIAYQANGQFTEALQIVRRSHEGFMAKNGKPDPELEHRVRALEHAVAGRFDLALTEAQRALEVEIQSCLKYNWPYSAQLTRKYYAPFIRLLEERARAAGQLPPDYVPFDEVVKQQGQRDGQ